MSQQYLHMHIICDKIYKLTILDTIIIHHHLVTLFTLSSEPLDLCGRATIVTQFFFLHYITHGTYDFTPHPKAKHN